MQRAVRGRLRDRVSYLRHDSEKRSTVAGEQVRNRKKYPSRLSGPFLSYTGRGAFFLFGQEPKRKNGGRIEQAASCDSAGGIL